MQGRGGGGGQRLMVDKSDAAGEHVLLPCTPHHPTKRSLQPNNNQTKAGAEFVTSIRPTLEILAVSKNK